MCSLNIGYACWCGASLSAMPSGVVPHYRSCLLVFVPHYQPYLLVWCLTIGHACWSNATATDSFTSRVKMEEGWLQVWWYSYRGAITSDMSADPVPLLDMPDCTVQLYQTYMLGSFIQVRVFANCCSIMHGIWSVTNPSDMPTSEVSLPRVSSLRCQEVVCGLWLWYFLIILTYYICKIYQLPS